MALVNYLHFCFQGTVESDDVGFDLVPGSTDLASSNGSLVFVKYIQPNSAAYGKLRYVSDHCIVLTGHII